MDQWTEWACRSACCWRISWGPTASIVRNSSLKWWVFWIYCSANRNTCTLHIYKSMRYEFPHLGSLCSGVSLNHFWKLSAVSETQSVLRQSHSAREKSWVSTPLYRGFFITPDYCLSLNTPERFQNLVFIPVRLITVLAVYNKLVLVHQPYMTRKLRSGRRETYFIPHSLANFRSTYWEPSAFAQKAEKRNGNRTAEIYYWSRLVLYSVFDNFLL